MIIRTVIWLIIMFSHSFKMSNPVRGVEWIQSPDICLVHSQVWILRKYYLQAQRVSRQARANDLWTELNHILLWKLSGWDFNVHQLYISFQTTGLPVWHQQGKSKSLCGKFMLAVCVCVFLPILVGTIPCHLIHPSVDQFSLYTHSGWIKVEQPVDKPGVVPAEYVFRISP